LVLIGVWDQAAIEPGSANEEARLRGLLAAPGGVGGCYFAASSSSFLAGITCPLSAASLAERPKATAIRVE